MFSHVMFRYSSNFSSGIYKSQLALLIPRLDTRSSQTPCSPAHYKFRAKPTFLNRLAPRNRMRFNPWFCSSAFSKSRAITVWRLGYWYSMSYDHSAARCTTWILYSPSDFTTALNSGPIVSRSFRLSTMNSMICLPHDFAA